MLRRVRARLFAATLAVPLACATAAADGFDHSLFDALLRRHVTGGCVDYDAFARAPEFPRYLEQLAAADPEKLEEKDRLAFWIDAYNAYTIELLNRHHERQSIRNINKTLGLLKAKGPWQEKIVRAGGALYTLDEVEHDIIRKRFHEPRIHFALVCAAASCPPLRSEAYTGARLEAQLTDQARVFLLGQPAKNRVDAAAGVVYLSPIFGWYKDDFGGDDATVGRFIAAYHPEGPEKRLLLSGHFKVLETPYDWSLNSLEPAAAAR
jgi:hypothetical protein